VENTEVIRRAFAAAVLALFMSSASASATTAAAFGDSFTAPSTSWYYKLGLGDDNFAKSGAVANGALTDLAGRRLATQVKKWSSAGKPVGNAIVLFIGINDVRQTGSLFGSQSAYRSALSNFRPAAVAAVAKLIVVCIPDLGQMPLYKGTSQQATMTSRSQAWNAFVKDTAATYKAVVVDLFNLLVDPTLIGPDKLHPNARGQQVIANAIGAKL
jgi:lysophospholipase L1-like esterase